LFALRLVRCRIFMSESAEVEYTIVSQYRSFTLEGNAHRVAKFPNTSVIKNSPGVIIQSYGAFKTIFSRLYVGAKKEYYSRLKEAESRNYMQRGVSVCRKRQKAEPPPYKAHLNPQEPKHFCKLLFLSLKLFSEIMAQNNTLRKCERMTRCLLLL
jgi:hypothetical protein